MGKVTYRLTPPLWAVGECESRYEEMAAKGWLLEKRGAFLDKYRRGEPQTLRYRLEISGSTFTKGALPLPEEQMQLYEECGWTLAARAGDIYLFRASRDSETPEIYSDGTQQAAMLTGLNKRYRRDILGAVFWIAWLFVGAVIRGFDLLSWKTLAEADLLLAGLLLFWLLMLWKAVHGMARMRLLINRLRGGSVMEHGSPQQKRHLPGRAVSGVLSTLVLLCFLGCGAELLLRDTAPLPDTSGNLPYLLGEEVFSVRRADENEVTSFGREINYVKSMPTLFAPVQYHTSEYIIPEGGSDRPLYQHVYRTWNAGLALSLARSLAEDSVFSHSEDYTQVEIDGLSLALVADNGLELIAVRGNTVVYALYIHSADSDQLTRLLEAYAKKP